MKVLAISGSLRAASINTALLRVAARLAPQQIEVTLFRGVGVAPPFPLLVLIFYLAASFVTFLVYAVDKSAAVNGNRRIREHTLHLLALIGGWPGALIAQKLLRHKSKKRSFQAVFRITVVLHSAMLGMLLAFGGKPY